MPSTPTKPPAVRVTDNDVIADNDVITDTFDAACRAGRQLAHNVFVVETDKLPVGYQERVSSRNCVVKKVHSLTAKEEVINLQRFCRVAPELYWAFKSDTGNTYITMEFVEGQTLDTYLGQGNAFPREEIDNMLHMLLSDGCHHPDLNFGNIIVVKGHDDSIYLRVIDFGPVPFPRNHKWLRFDSDFLQSMQNDIDRRWKYVQEELKRRSLEDEDTDSGTETELEVESDTENTLTVTTDHDPSPDPGVDSATTSLSSSLTNNLLLFGGATHENVPTVSTKSKAGPGVSGRIAKSKSKRSFKESTMNDETPSSKELPSNEQQQQLLLFGGKPKKPRLQHCLQLAMDKYTTLGKSGDVTNTPEPNSTKRKRKRNPSIRVMFALAMRRYMSAGDTTTVSTVVSWMDMMFSSPFSPNLRTYIQTYLNAMMRQNVLAKVDCGNQDIMYLCPQDKFADLHKYLDGFGAPPFTNMMKHAMLEHLVADTDITIKMILDWISNLYPNYHEPTHPIEYTQARLREMVYHDLLVLVKHGRSNIAYRCPKSKFDMMIKYLGGCQVTDSKANESKVDTNDSKVDTNDSKVDTSKSEETRYKIKHFVRLYADAIRVKWAKCKSKSTWVDPQSILKDIGPDAMATLICAMPENAIQTVMVKQDDGTSWSAIPIGEEGERTRTVFSKENRTFYYDIDNDIVITE